MTFRANKSPACSPATHATAPNSFGGPCGKGAPGQRTCLSCPKTFARGWLASSAPRSSARGAWYLQTGRPSSGSGGSQTGPASKPCSCFTPAARRCACPARLAAPWAAPSAQPGREASPGTSVPARSSNRWSLPGRQLYLAGSATWCSWAWASPLANYPRTWRAVELIHDGLGISARHITVSTVGLAPGIRRLAHERLPVNLAVSLHAARDSLRDELVPINRRYPLAVLVESCAEYLRNKRRRLSFEWALIDEVNDTERDAAELAELARPLHAHVNLIPLNPTPGYLRRGTPPDGVARFASWLAERGVNVTVRDNRGTDIAAACGQLAGRKGLDGAKLVTSG